MGDALSRPFRPGAVASCVLAMAVAIGGVSWAMIPEVQLQAGRRQRVSPWFWLDGEARLVTCTRSTDAREVGTTRARCGKDASGQWVTTASRTTVRVEVVERPTIHRRYQVVGGDDRSRLVELRESLQPSASSSGFVAPATGHPRLQRVALDPTEDEEPGRLLEAREDEPVTTPAGTFVTSYRRFATDGRLEECVETWSVAQLPLPVRRRRTWRRSFASGTSPLLEEVTELTSIVPTRALPPTTPPRSPWSRLRVGTRVETCTRRSEVAEWVRSEGRCTVTVWPANAVGSPGGSRRTYFFEWTDREWTELDRVVAVDEREVRLESARGSCGLWGPAWRRSIPLHEPVEPEPGDLLEAREGVPVTVPAGAFVTSYRRVAQADAGGPRLGVEVETWTAAEWALPVRRRVTWRIQCHDGSWSPPGEETTELVSAGPTVAPPRTYPHFPNFQGLTPPF